jgi:hypothetical protein
LSTLKTSINSEQKCNPHTIFSPLKTIFTFVGL